MNTDKTAIETPVKFRIEWQDVSCGWDSRPFTRPRPLMKGLSTYPDLTSANDQIALWSLYFPFNAYAIVKAA